MELREVVALLRRLSRSLRERGEDMAVRTSTARSVASWMDSEIVVGWIPTHRWRRTKEKGRKRGWRVNNIMISLVHASASDNGLDSVLGVVPQLMKRKTQPHAKTCIDILNLTLLFT